MTPAGASLGIVVGTGIASLVVAALFAKSAFASSPGGDDLQSVAGAVREGAKAFLHRQYRTVAMMTVAVAAAILVLYLARHAAELAWKTTLAFVVGAACSGAAGYWGMFVSLRANVRVANAARSSVADALRVAVRGGAAVAFAVVSSSLLGVSVLFVAFGGLDSPRTVPYQLLGFAFGASFVALFAQLGGGIYTKAADVGADMIGKVEAGIPEDDARNPAVIADLVGDNVGDCVGRGADLFESTAAENIGAMILGVTLFAQFGASGVVFPLVAAACGLVASIAGVLAVRLSREAESPIVAMVRGYAIATIVAGAGLWVAVRQLLANNAWLACAALIGLVASVLFAAIANYYTSYRQPPTRSIAESSVTGAATNVITGLAVALGCTALPVLAISAAVLGSYWCGLRALPGVAGAGVYGTAVATAGMLSTVGYILSMDVFGPIADNAGGIAEMSAQPSDVRRRTDVLDATGNTTKALTKGYAIGSAALAAFLLLAAYLERVSIENVDIGKVPVFIAALLGAAVTFLFSALAIRAVARDARAVVEEVRRQFRENPGIIDRTAKPDFGRCVDIVTLGALKGMLAPGLLAVAAPIVIGIAFGAEAVAAELLVGTICGVLLALMMNTGGGAWDNAKKLIETGALGGPGSAAHKAAVVGDAVGDPLKDTAGPSLHILIKLVAAVALVAAPLFANHH